MDISVNQQCLGFLGSLVLGSVISVIYDFISSYNKVFKPSNTHMILTDLLFCIVTSIAVFYYCLFKTYGSLRLFVFIGVFGGFLIFKLTFSRYFILVYSFVLNLLKMALSSTFRLIALLFSPFFSAARNFKASTNAKLREIKDKKRKKPLENM